MKKKTLKKHNFHIKHHKTDYLVEYCAQYLYTWTVSVCKTQTGRILPDHSLTTHAFDRVAVHPSVYRLITCPSFHEKEPPLIISIAVMFIREFLRESYENFCHSSLVSH